ncbi:MAG: lasso peptide biosynthesis PqqD family chaperone [Propionibacterium sp.]|nr:lasso peptide biosynthesis PqqD family chaperone [Actinomyces sp.]MDN6793654.1 lasso peptide biosynthesis PqqD family chaperone [Propionibacterium sp.]
MTRRTTSTSTRLHRVSTEYGDVVLNEATGAYWHLNASASRIVAVLESGGTVQDAVADLVATYGIEEGMARRDIEAVAQRLRDLGVL